MLLTLLSMPRKWKCLKFAPSTYFTNSASLRKLAASYRWSAKLVVDPNKVGPSSCAIAASVRLFRLTISVLDGQMTQPATFHHHFLLGLIFSSAGFLQVAIVADF